MCMYFNLKPSLLRRFKCSWWHRIKFSWYPGPFNCYQSNYSPGLVYMVKNRGNTMAKEKVLEHITSLSFIPSLCTALLTRAWGKPMLAIFLTNAFSDSSKTGHGSGKEDLSSQTLPILCPWSSFPIGGNGEG